MLRSISPFFIVGDLAQSLEFYRSKLGFQVHHLSGGDEEHEHFFAIVGRDSVTIMLKHITSSIHPQPNHRRHEWARWDAFISTGDPDSLYEEFVSRGAPVHRELADTSEGLRAFEIVDHSGYVLCFGRPR